MSVENQFKKITGVFVAAGGWVQFQFADQSRNKPEHMRIETYSRLAHDIDDAAWVALRHALTNTDQWIPVHGD